MFLEKREIEKQLKDLEEIKLGADESSQRLIKDKQLLETKYQAAQERLNLLEEKKDELDKVCRTLSKVCNCSVPKIFFVSRKIRP